MAMQNEIKEYIKSVKKQIVCPTAESRQMLRELQENVFDFAQTNPDADMAQLVEQFGTPEEIAKTYLSDAEPNKIKKAINIRKVCVLAIVTAVLIFTSVMIAIFVDSHIDHHGSLYIEIEEGVTYIDLCDIE